MVLGLMDFQAGGRGLMMPVNHSMAWVPKGIILKEARMEYSAKISVTFTLTYPHPQMNSCNQVKQIQVIGRVSLVEMRDESLQRT